MESLIGAQFHDGPVQCDFYFQGSGVESLDDWAHITNYKNQRVKTPVPSRKERNYTDMLMGKMRHSKVMVSC